MSKTSKPERKRTLTVTIGPKSWAQIVERQSDMQRKYAGVEISITSIVAGMAAQILNTLRDPPVSPGEDEWRALGE